MPLHYVLEMAAVSLGLSVLGLGGAFIASRIYDRNTRRYDEIARRRQADEAQSIPSPSHPSSTRAPAGA